MTYWNDKVADVAHLRLFVTGDGWRLFKDKMSADSERIEEAGTQRAVESALLNVLNATNVVVLTGTGSSFAATNDEAKLSPAGMWDVWVAVRTKVGAPAFQAVCDTFASAKIDDNIERLLTLCKIPLIRTALSQLDDVDGWQFLGAVGTRLATLMPDFDPRTYGCPKLLALIERSDAFEVRRDSLKVYIRPKRTGTQKPKQPI